MKRRGFLAYSTVTLGVSSLPASSIAALDAVTGFESPGFAIADNNIGHSESFAAHWHEQQVPVYTYNGDITPVWVDVMAPHMRNSAPVIAGHTSKACFHCLVQLAAGMGYYPDRVTIHPSILTEDQPEETVSWLLLPTRQTFRNTRT